MTFGNLSFEHLPAGNSGDKNFFQLTVAQVDDLADSLVRDYNNEKFRKWYCGVIYEFGTQKVELWRSRAKEGREPAKLFSKYVSDARRLKNSSGEVGNESRG